jgi:hypothetical protein
MLELGSAVRAGCTSPKSQEFRCCVASQAQSMCELTLSLSERTEGVIILYLGTSACSFSYVACRTNSIHLRTCLPEFHASHSPRQSISRFSCNSQHPAPDLYRLPSYKSTVLEAPYHSCLLPSRCLLPVKGFPPLWQVQQQALPCRKGPGCSPSPSSSPSTTSAKAEGNLCQ